MSNRDVRFTSTDIECRSDGESQVTISGYALKFDRPSEDLGFIETLDRSCLNEADMSNVVALVNHDDNLLLGRTGNNLTLTVDDVGLRFDLVPNNTSYTRDLIENMSTGLINKCSFAFTIDKDTGDEWRKEDDGTFHRVIKKISRLFDVSIVTSPAYMDTEAMLSARSQKKFEALQRKPVEQELELLAMELDF